MWIDRLASKPIVDPPYRTRARRVIPHFFHSLQAPVASPRTSGSDDRTDRVVQTSCVVGLLSNINIYQQPKETTTPIGSPPSSGSIQASVARLGQALRQAFHKILPNAALTQAADACTRERLQIIGKPFFKVMI